MYNFSAFYDSINLFFIPHIFENVGCSILYKDISKKLSDSFAIINKTDIVFQ